ncbi:hypothetical protein GMOD_00003953 [Pyrenophora seminiperda CCB06]|uniref:Uncharacterized protein n=1 Tax=Pyrenophora seminiperda CCB06 TaxID=1302712 RepID=A0A3M7M0C5_9PLEO|nr:hypothetical protein GMOD_00003953 [Pyrenophora seminiperda CCB06]
MVKKISEAEERRGRSRSGTSSKQRSRHNGEERQEEHKTYYKDDIEVPKSKLCDCQGENRRLRAERNNEEVGMEELKRLCVEFIVTPALYKCGTLNGDRFDKEEAICRAAVVIEGLN